MTAEALSRIDADLGRRVVAYLDSSVTAPTSRALITDLLAALIPEPPTVASVEEWSAAMDAERQRQVEHGYDDAHDRAHGPAHLLNWAIDYARRGRVLEAATMMRSALHVLTPEPPTDDERERVLRGLDHWAQFAGDPAVRVDCAAARDLLRHRGPITDEIIQRACRAHYVEVWGDDLDPEYVFPPADVRAMRAALEAGSNGHRGSITRGGDARHVDALRDLAEHGLRFDLNPTMAITTADEVYAQWAAYARRMDESVRAHARAALAVAEAAR